MQIKDHYKTLGVPPQATLQEIKAAYRQLMHRYHPDKNKTDSYAEHYFHEIREAYEILSHPKLRPAYDQERWLAGHSRDKAHVAITPRYIYNECLKLSQRTTTTNNYPLSQIAIYDYALVLLSDSNLAILRREENPELNGKIVQLLLTAFTRLDYYYFQEIYQQLLALALDDQNLVQQIDLELRRKKHEMQWERAKPWVILIAALLLCCCMFFVLEE